MLSYERIDDIDRDAEIDHFLEHLEQLLLALVGDHGEARPPETFTLPDYVLAHFQSQHLQLLLLRLIPGQHRLQSDQLQGFPV